MDLNPRHGPKTMTNLGPAWAAAPDLGLDMR